MPALAPGTSFTAHPDLAFSNAVQGRQVAITVLVGYPDGANDSTRSWALASAAQRLQELLEKGSTVRFDRYDDSAEVQVTGRLASSWLSLGLLKSEAWRQAQAGAAVAGLEWESPYSSATEGVGIVDLELGVDKTYNPSFFDHEGTVNADGSLAWDNIVADSASDVGEGFGKGAAAVGEFVGKVGAGAVGGVFSGLGTGWSIVLILVLLVVLVVVAFIYARPLLAAAGGG
jgi:hypothetical protein